MLKVVVSRDLEIVPKEEVAKTLLSMSRVVKNKPEVTWPETVGSWAWAEKVILPETVPGEGEEMETVGAVVSGATETVTVAEEVTEPLLLLAVRV